MCRGTDGSIPIFSTKPQKRRLARIGSGPQPDRPATDFTLADCAVSLRLSGYDWGKRMYRRMIVAAVAALLIWGAPAPSPAPAQAVLSDGRGAIADTVLTDETGQPLWIGSLRGKIVFIDFWGAWCRPCMQEMQSIRQLQAGLGNLADRVAFVFVSIKPDHFAADTDWLRQSGIAGRNYRWETRKPEQFQAFFNSAMGKWLVPNTLLLDPAGNVVKWARGTSVDWSIHIDTFRRLVQPQPAAAF